MLLSTSGINLCHVRGTVAAVYTLALLGIAVMSILGCDDPVVDKMMEPVIGEMVADEQKPVPNDTMIGEVKQSQEGEEPLNPTPELLPAPGRIREPLHAKLLEVTYYKDHRLT